MAQLSVDAAAFVIIGIRRTAEHARLLRSMQLEEPNDPMNPPAGRTAGIADPWPRRWMATPWGWRWVTQAWPCSPPTLADQNQSGPESGQQPRQ